MHKIGQSVNLGSEQNSWLQCERPLGHQGRPGSNPNYPADEDHIAFTVDIKINIDQSPGFRTPNFMSPKTHPFVVYRRCSCGLEWNFPVEEADISDG